MMINGATRREVLTLYHHQRQFMTAADTAYGSQAARGSGRSRGRRWTTASTLLIRQSRRFSHGTAVSGGRSEAPLDGPRPL